MGIRTEAFKVEGGKVLDAIKEPGSVFKVPRRRGGTLAAVATRRVIAVERVEPDA